MKTYVVTLLGAVLSALSAFGQGRVLWDESANGPLSNDYMHPTVLGTLQWGTNSLAGATAFVPTGGNGAIYGDYFRILVPDASCIAALWLQVDRPVAIWVGQGDFSSRLGDVLDPTNGDLLYQLGLGTISAGAYDMYVKNDDIGPSPSVSSYRLDFFVQAVPEPSTFMLAVFAIGLVAICHRKQDAR